MLAAWLAAAVAVAGTPEEWSSSYDARLSQALGAEPSEAIAVYEALVAQMPAQQEQRGEVLYWLGRARWSAGDLSGAKRSLESALSYRSSRLRARSLLGRIALRDQAIQDLPFVQDYRLNTTPWVRGWERGKDSDLSVEDGPDGRALRWTTELADGQTDFLAFGFDTDRDRVSSISLSVRSEGVPAKVRVVLEDSDGQLWMSSKQTVRMGRWTELTLPIADFTSTGGIKSLDARTLRSLTFQDLTALHTNSRGSNTIWIDDLTVR